MAFAAYCESFGVSTTPPAVPTSAVVTHLPKWVVMDVTVPSVDALLVRRALARCPGAGVLRCIPRLDENRVRLEVRLPAHMADEVMHCVMVCVPTGEVGHLLSWRCHLRRHGLNSGL
jgi:hypothetical protein